MDKTADTTSTNSQKIHQSNAPSTRNPLSRLRGKAGKTEAVGAGLIATSGMQKIDVSAPISRQDLNHMSSALRDKVEQFQSYTPASPPPTTRPTSRHVKALVAAPKTQQPPPESESSSAIVTANGASAEKLEPLLPGWKPNFDRVLRNFDLGDLQADEFRNLFYEVRGQNREFVIQDLYGVGYPLSDRRRINDPVGCFLRLSQAFQMQALQLALQQGMRVEVLSNPATVFGYEIDIEDRQTFTLSNADNERTQFDSPRGFRRLLEGTPSYTEHLTSNEDNDGQAVVVPPTPRPTHRKARSSDAVLQTPKSGTGPVVPTPTPVVPTPMPVIPTATPVLPQDKAVVQQKEVNAPSKSEVFTQFLSNSVVNILAIDLLKHAFNLHFSFMGSLAGSIALQGACYGLQRNVKGTEKIRRALTMAGRISLGAGGIALLFARRKTGFLIKVINGTVLTLLHGASSRVVNCAGRCFSCLSGRSAANTSTASRL